MGLFSFLKNAGANLFGHKNEPEAAQQSTVSADIVKQQRETLLRGVVEGLHLPVSNLGITLDGDVATVTGEAETQAIKEKVILAIGNVGGVATVDDQMTVTNPEPEAEFYTVVSGDSLSKIAKHFYGDPMKYPVIFEANKPMLTDPDLIYPGQVLRIPAL